jgi:hypothetical protein
MTDGCAAERRDWINDGEAMNIAAATMDHVALRPRR